MFLNTKRSETRLQSHHSKVILNQSSNYSTKLILIIRIKWAAM